MDWRERAACLGVDAEIFFPVNTAGPIAAADLRAAKAVCARCPVRRQCLSWAMSMNVVGIWGGLSEHERRRLRRKEKVGAC